MSQSSTSWIRGPAFDLAFVFGGAVLTLLVAALGIREPRLLPLLFWIWIVGFEGSHFWATFSRTYIDTKYRTENKSVLLGSLIFFILPVLTLVLDHNGSSVSLTTVYGFFIFVWSLYHNARQHFGFLSIYSKKARLSQAQKSQYTSVLYLGVCSAQAYFLFNFKAIVVLALPATTTWSPNVVFLLGAVPMGLTLVAAIRLIWLAIRDSRNESGLVPALYVGTCLAFYSTMFYYIAPMDVFIRNPSGVQTLILISIMNSMFHNIQYHAIVWHYGQTRYNSNSTAPYGLAKLVNHKTLNYMAVAAILGLGFGFTVWNLAQWPWVDGLFPTATEKAWAIALFFGIIGHHFFIDQFIWRPSKQTELRSYLNI
jgi:hypothetical protein